MRVGLIDVDGHNYPNLPLMKLSAWHKSLGHDVEWYNHESGKWYDIVYMSKVFSFTKDYAHEVRADAVIKGGSRYAISLVNGKEVYDKSKDINLPYGVEHIMPDYGLYGIENTAYGFMSRGCPRGCGFCHVAAKEGRCSEKVADLKEFWTYQKEIVLMDPNILACRDSKDMLKQLGDSGAKVDINRGLDARLLTDENIELIRNINLTRIHFAWDRMVDSKIIKENLLRFKLMTGLPHRKVSVYILTNFDTSLEEDLERIYFCRSIDFSPFPMVYNKSDAPSIYKKLQEWCNGRIFWAAPTFDGYLEYKAQKRKKAN